MWLCASLTNAGAHGSDCILAHQALPNIVIDVSRALHQGLDRHDEKGDGNSLYGPCQASISAVAFSIRALLWTFAFLRLKLLSVT